MTEDIKCSIRNTCYYTELLREALNTLKLAVHVMYGGRTQPTRETSETDAIPYIRWQHMIVSAVKVRPPLMFLVLVLARAMCRTASKCFATFRLCERGLVSAEST